MGKKMHLNKFVKTHKLTCSCPCRGIGVKCSGPALHFLLNLFSMITSFCNRPGSPPILNFLLGNRSFPTQVDALVSITLILVFLGNLPYCSLYFLFQGDTERS